MLCLYSIYISVAIVVLRWLLGGVGLALKLLGWFSLVTLRCSLPERPAHRHWFQVPRVFDHFAHV